MAEMFTKLLLVALFPPYLVLRLEPRPMEEKTGVQLSAKRKVLVAPRWSKNLEKTLHKKNEEVL